MIKPEQFKFFSQLVKDSSGIALTRGKEYLLESRLNELCKVLGLRDIDALYQKAKFKMTPRLKEQIVEAMTTNETYFFRDQHPFDTLKKHIIKELMARNEPRKELRFWSAAASTGQEAYSIAMIIAEHFPQLANWRVDILGTDISQQAISKAREGRYTQVEVNRGLPITMLVKYFKQQGAFWMVQDKLKKLVKFRQFNLLSPFVGIGQFDCIFCRYVLIYFDQETKKKITDKLVKVLRPEGYLFLGATETPVGLDPSMKRVTFGKTICWKKSGG